MTVLTEPQDQSGQKYHFDWPQTTVPLVPSVNLFATNEWHCWFAFVLTVAACDYVDGQVPVRSNNALLLPTTVQQKSRSITFLLLTLTLGRYLPSCFRNANAGMHESNGLLLWQFTVEGFVQWFRFVLMFRAICLYRIFTLLNITKFKYFRYWKVTWKCKFCITSYRLLLQDLIETNL